MTVVDVISIVLGILSLVPSRKQPDAERRIKSAYKSAKSRLRSDLPQWKDIEPADASFLADESNWKLILQEAFGQIEPLSVSDLNLKRLDSKNSDDPSLAEAFLRAFRNEVAKDAEIATLISAKNSERIVLRTLGAQPSRNERLKKIKEASTARMVSRWLAVGVEPDTALRMAHEVPSSMAAHVEVFANNPGVKVVVAPIGAGKSTLAERVLHFLIGQADLDERLVPVWLDSFSLSGNAISDAIDTCVKDLGNPENARVCLIADGLDEVDLGTARRILNDIRALHMTGAVASAFIVTRPIDLGFGEDEAETIAALDDEEALALVSLNAKRTVNAWERDRWPHSISEASKLPLFALLLGIWLRENPMAPVATSELVEHLVKRALPDDDQSVSMNEWLEILAIRATASESRVALRDLPHLSNRAAVAKTGFAALDSRTAGFVLTLLQEWFAAKAFLSGTLTVDVLIARPEHLSRWRGALRILLGIAPTDVVDGTLKKLAAVDPSLVGELLQEGSSLYSTRRDITPLPGPLECGEAIRGAAEAFYDALGPLGSYLFETRDGVLPTLGIFEDGGLLSCAWLVGYKGDERVAMLPPEAIRGSDISLRLWARIRWAVPSHKPYWAWRWVHDDLRSGIQKLLTSGVPLLDHGLIHDEAVWATAKGFMDGVHRDGPLDVRGTLELIERIGLSDDDEVLCGSGGKQVVRPLFPLVSKLRELDSLGEERLMPPWPLADTSPRGESGWVWNFYTTEQLKRRIEVVYSGALKSYEELCSGVFASLSGNFSKWNLLPARLCFYLHLGKEEARSEPTATWYLVPLPRGRASEVVVEIVDEHPSWEESAAVMRKAVDENRADVPGISYGMTRTSLGDVLCGEQPTTSLCYKWLAAELLSIKWINR